MKAYLKALKTINNIWLILVFLIIFLAAVPVIPGTILVKVPGPDGWTTTDTNGTVNTSGIVGVHNGGFFPFNNFYFVMRLYAENGTTLAEFASQKTNLLPGLWTNFTVYFVLNKSAVTSSVVQAILFSEVTFSTLVYFNTNYLFDFQVQVGVKGNLTVGPLVNDFQINKNETVVVQNGTNYILTVPYHINTTSILQNRDLYINGTFSNTTAELGNFTAKAILGTNYTGNFTAILSQAAYEHLKTSSDTLYVNTTLSLGIYNWTQNFTVAWSPPSKASPGNGSSNLAFLEQSALRQPSIGAAMSQRW